MLKLKKAQCQHKYSGVIKGEGVGVVTAARKHVFTTCTQHMQTHARGSLLTRPREVAPVIF